MTNKSILGNGTQVHGYTIEKLIGSGSFANVYLASKKNESGTHQIAIKHIILPNEDEYNDVLRSMGGSFQATKEHFSKIFEDVTREISTFKMLSSKSNNNIITYYDNDVEYTEPPLKYDVFIKMEYVTPIIKQSTEQNLTIREILKIGEHILNALKICHENGVIHRDIKDDNLFVNADGMYKIGDFGVSTELQKNERAKTQKGTLAFIAPEIMNRDEESYDNTIDIYSLGIVLYKFLNGNRLPFLPAAPQAFSVGDIEMSVQRRLNGEEIPAALFAPKLVSEIIQKACASRENRYNNVQEMLNDIERVKQLLTDEELNEVVLTLSISPQKEQTAMYDTLNSLNNIHEGINLFDYENSVSNTPLLNAETPLNRVSGTRNMEATFGVAVLEKEAASTPEEKQSLFATSAHRISNIEEQRINSAPIQPSEPQNQKLEQNIPIPLMQMEADSEQSTAANKMRFQAKATESKKKYIVYISAIVVLLGLALLVFLPFFQAAKEVTFISFILKRYILLGLIFICLFVTLFLLGRDLNKVNYADSVNVKYRGNEALLKLERISMNISINSAENHIDKEQLRVVSNQLDSLLMRMRSAGDFGLKNEKLYQVETDISRELDLLENTVEVFIAQGSSNSSVLKNINSLQMLLRLRSKITV